MPDKLPSDAHLARHLGKLPGDGYSPLAVHQNHLGRTENSWCPGCILDKFHQNLWGEVPSFSKLTR